jgi:hypothetical protein
MMTVPQQVLNQIGASNHTTCFWQLLSPKFLLKLFSRSPGETQSLPPPAVRLSSKHKVKWILSSLNELKPHLLLDATEANHSFEFENIENLGGSLLNVDTLQTLEEVFMQFTFLKSWIFCIELRSSHGDIYNEIVSKVVRLHFYGFLEAMKPYFPSSFVERLEIVCEKEIQGLKEEVVLEGGREIRELIEMLWSQY